MQGCLVFYHLSPPLVPYGHGILLLLAYHQLFIYILNSFVAVVIFIVLNEAHAKNYKHITYSRAHTRTHTIKRDKKRAIFLKPQNNTLF